MDERAAGLPPPADCCSVSNVSVTVQPNPSVVLHGGRNELYERTDVNMGVWFHSHDCRDIAESGGTAFGTSLVGAIGRAVTHDYADSMAPTQRTLKRSIT